MELGCLDVAAPWLSYVPLPGLHLVATWLAPADPLTRFHARQGAWIVVPLWIWLLIIGLLTPLSDAAGWLATMGLLSGLPLAAALVAGLVGVVGAAMGRYTRIRPVWDLLTRRES